MRILGYGKSFSLFIFLLAFSSLFQFRAQAYSTNEAIFVSPDETLSKILTSKGEKFEVFNASCKEYWLELEDSVSRKCIFSYRRTNALGTQTCINVPAVFFKEKENPLDVYTLNSGGFFSEGECGEYEKVAVKPVIDEPRTSNQLPFYISLLAISVLTGFIIYLLARRGKE